MIPPERADICEGFDDLANGVHGAFIGDPTKHSGAMIENIVARAKKQFHMPRAVYSESGVDAIIDPAAHMGRQNRDAIMLEALAALR